MAALHEEGCHENSIFICLLVCKGGLRDGAEVARPTVFQEIRPRPGLITGDFYNEKLGGGGLP